MQKNNPVWKIRWFKAFYGVEPTTVDPLFHKLGSVYPDISYKKCLMTMNWFYLYSAYPVLSARWKWSEKFIGEQVIKNGMKMFKVAKSMIKFALKCRRKN